MRIIIESWKVKNGVVNLTNSTDKPVELIIYGEEYLPRKFYPDEENIDKLNGPFKEYKETIKKAYELDNQLMEEEILFNQTLNELCVGDYFIGTIN